MKAQWKRIEAIIGNDEAASVEDQMTAFYEHLLRNFKFPFEVTGIEDFNWEEYYVFGGHETQVEYEQLKKTQPSYQDRYDLLGIEKGVFSEWMLFHGNDIGAYVKRKSDGMEFCLGLSELKGVDKKSANAKLLDDFAVFFANSR